MRYDSILSIKIIITLVAFTACSVISFAQNLPESDNKDTTLSNAPGKKDTVRPNISDKKDTTQPKIDSTLLKVNPFLSYGKDSAQLSKIKQIKIQELQKAKSADINKPIGNFEEGDKYLKEKEQDHRYDTFEVFNMKGLDKRHAVVGLLTNTLERDVRYVDKGEVEKKVTYTSGFIDRLDEKGQVVPNDRIPVSALRFNDKIFVIIGDHDYRYIDGKRLVGNRQLVDKMVGGKPITEITFFYELRNAGLIDKSITFKQFSRLTPDEKRDILKGIK